MQPWTAIDEAAMREVARLAQQGRPTAAPNPLVGAVLVHEDKIVSGAYHHAAGESHAEVLALESAGPLAHGASLYINLEPCCHQGRTPPCAPQIAEAGVSRVVVGMLDPDPRVSGGGVQFLRDAGLDVQGCPDPWVERCLEVNRDFVHSVLHGRPFVTWKYAMTLDGRVATAGGDARWITGAAARQQVHAERALHQAILVGSGTVVADDPHLNVRGIPGARQPIRVVLDRRGRTPADARMFNSPGGPIWIGYGALAEESWKARMREAGAELFAADSLGEALHYLNAHAVRSVFLESGPELATAFLEQNFIQRVLVFVAPMWVGGPAPGPLAGRGVSLLKDAWRLQRGRWTQVEDDWLLEGELDSQWRSWPAKC
jgi:diaminohydroxyphosphoribosylaminopyrimidine deaminase / 5-amino-6-(5-phosphoribosylamino)uracil reductase